MAVCSEIHTKYINILCGQNVEFLGAFVKLRKATISYVMSVRPNVRPFAWNSSTPTRRIFIKSDITLLFENLSTKIQVSLKCDKNNGYFT